MDILAAIEKLDKLTYSLDWCSFIKVKCKKDVEHFSMILFILDTYVSMCVFMLFLVFLLL